MIWAWLMRWLGVPGLCIVAVVLFYEGAIGLRWWPITAIPYIGPVLQGEIGRRIERANDKRDERWQAVIDAARAELAAEKAKQTARLAAIERDRLLEERMADERATSDATALENALRAISEQSKVNGKPDAQCRPRTCTDERVDPRILRSIR